MHFFGKYYYSFFCYIRNNAFRDCSTLVQVTISNSVTSIGIWPFNVSQSATFIGEGCFRNCSTLHIVNIHSSLTVFGKSCIGKQPLYTWSSIFINDVISVNEE